MSLENHTNHYYYIRSKNKAVGETDIKFTNQPHRLNDIRSFMIKKIIIPYSFYPINSNNNTIVIRKNGDTQDRTATIIPGAYTLSELKTEIKTQMDALAGPAQTYTITDGNTNNKITIAQNSSTFIYRGSSTMNNIIGFASTDTTNIISHTGTKVYNISGTNYIDVFSNQLTKYDSRVRTGGIASTNFICSIPLSNFMNGDIILEKFDDYIFDYHPHAENIIDIELKNEFNQSLGGSTGLNGQNWQMELQFHSYSSNHPNVYNRSSNRKNINNIGSRLF
jgi:hypothetical protein